jgi:hypothetical protein
MKDDDCRAKPTHAVVGGAVHRWELNVSRGGITRER